MILNAVQSGGTRWRPKIVLITPKLRTLENIEYIQKFHVSKLTALPGFFLLPALLVVFLFFKPFILIALG